MSDDPGRSAAEAIAATLAAAWNAHDMTAFGALFHADATFVNRYGAYWRGVDRIVAEHRGIHASIYRDSVVHVRLLDADTIAGGVVIAHLLTRLDAGAAHPAGPHRNDTLIMAVLTERGGEWRIQAAENATLGDPRSGAPIFLD